MLRPVLPRLGRPLLRRSLYVVPPLDHNPQRGIPGLLSDAGFHVAWTEYQSLMVDKINAMTSDTPDENLQPKTLIMKTARSPSEASIFNHVSMAHNNKFFFDCLSADKPAPIPLDLENALCDSFSSLETLKLEFITTANAMFGPGFVWLVKHDNNKYSILTTYLAGSPYPEAHYRRQTTDMNNQNTASTAADYQRNKALYDSEPMNSVGAHGPKSTSGRIAHGGINLVPVLCVNTWQHVWVGDWGIGGKKAFLEAWWDRINWEVVSSNASITPKFVV